jgi:NAD+ synthase/NAD+ synthase (glutamine-hydrolysing)
MLVGDVAGNAQRIVAAAQRACTELSTDLLVLPELTLSGYPPEDLLFHRGFRVAIEKGMATLRTARASCGFLVGFPEYAGAQIFNSAALIEAGEIRATHRKSCLPNYKVFDEKRYFESGDRPCVFDVEGRKIGLTICEDLWFPEPAAKAKAAGAQLLLSINASPYHRAQMAERYSRMGARVKETQLPLLYVHGVGGQDEIVFDGASFGLDGEGSLTYQSESFRESIDIVEFDKAVITGPIAPPLTEEEVIYRALMTGTRDYVNKNHFPGVILGLSGGIDSALVLAICVDALGADRVHAVMMPSEYTAQMSLDDAREMAKIHGVKYTEIGISQIFRKYGAELAPLFEGLSADKTEENLQSRIRGTLLMALSNKFGPIVVTTGNKSEMATGYCTLYGDMAGGFAVIKDIVKTLVYRLSNWRNSKGRVIPQRVIDRPPSAELAPNQADQDTLPPYEMLDAVVERFMERDMSPEQIASVGYDLEAVRQVVRLIQVNEYKRRQAPPGVRITPRSFGKDWRYPITSGFRPYT